MPFPLTGPELAIAAAVALVSAFIRGLSGFGLALMLVPVLALTVEPVDAVVAANILGVAMGVFSYRGARLVAEPSVKTISALAIALTPVGLLLLSITPEAPARLAIALIAVTAFAAILLPAPAGHWQHGRPLAAATGILCGLCAGFAGMPGPPVIAFYLGRRVEKAAARASMFMIFLATSLTACAVAWISGVASDDALWLGLGLVPVVLLGNGLGSLAFGKVSDLVWRAFAGAIVAGAAIVAVVESF